MLLASQLVKSASRQSGLGMVFDSDKIQPGPMSDSSIITQISCECCSCPDLSFRAKLSGWAYSANPLSRERKCEVCSAGNAHTVGVDVVMDGRRAEEYDLAWRANNGET